MLGRRLNSGLFMRFSIAAVFTAAALSWALPCASATADKQLARGKGQVSYQSDAKSPPKLIFGSQIVADDAFAITGPKSDAQLRLRDSSTIDIGADTTVQVGRFHDAAPGETNQNVITVNNGVVHFVIHHPEGTAANYKFQTPTSQIAVRGTEGSILVSTSSTGVTTTTVTIASGSVVVTTGTTQAVVNAGQAVSAAAPAGTSASTSATMSNTVTAAPGAGTSAAAGTAGSGAGAAAGTAAAAAGTTAAAAGAVAAANNNGGTASPSPAPTATPTAVPTALPTLAPTPAPGSIVVVDVTGGVGSGNSSVDNTIVAVLGGPSAQTLIVTQNPCTTPLTFSVIPAGASTFTPATLPCTNGQISGNVVLTNNTYGTANYTVSGSGQTLTHTSNIFGEPTVTIGGAAITPLNNGIISFNGAATVTLSLTQAGPNPTLSVLLDCSATSAPNFHSTDPNVAGIGLNTFGNYALSGAAVASFTIMVRQGPQVVGAGSNLPPACNLDVSASAGGNFIIPINVTTTNIGITGVKRTIQTGPRVPK